VRAVLRPDDAGGSARLRERQAALPLCYVGAAIPLSGSGKSAGPKAG